MRARTDFPEPLENVLDFGRARLVDDKLASLHVITQRRYTAHVHALCAASPELVADPLCSHFALKLSEGQKHIQRQPTHAGGCVERLGDGHEGDVVALEHLDQLGEIHQRAGQAVDLVDDHNIDQPILNVGQQALDCWAIESATGDAAIIVLIADLHPAFRTLAGNIGLARLALSIERVELLLETFLGRFSGVNSAAKLADDLVAHAALRLFFRPKKTQPFQREPVMARAMADSD